MLFAYHDQIRRGAPWGTIYRIALCFESQLTLARVMLHQWCRAKLSVTKDRHVESGMKITAYEQLILNSASA